MSQVEDVKYYDEIKEKGNAYYIVAQMAALLNDTDNKVKEMENQKWYSKMVKTIFGKNKASLEEIKSNRDKISSYMASVIEELLKREIVSEQTIFGVENQINEIIEDQNSLKEKFIKFLTIFEAEKHFNRINHKIQNDSYESESELYCLCSIMADSCLDLFKNDADLEIVRNGLKQKGYISDENVLFSDMLLQFANTNEKIDDYSKIYYVLSGISSSSNKIAIICELLERYSLMPEKEKQGISTKKVVTKILDDYQYDEDAVVSTVLLYDCFVDGCKEYIEERNYDSISIDAHDSTEENNNVMNNKEINAGNERKCNTEEDFKTESFEMQDELIGNILQIDKDETIKYEYKRIHISSFINCMGTLEFDHCVLFYNESDDSDEITLGDGAKIIIRNSCVICKGFDENYFISCNKDSSNDVDVVLENSTFTDCSRFINLEGQNDNVSIRECKFNNCSDYFLAHLGKGTVDISDNLIFQECLTQFNIDNKPNNSCLFYINYESGDNKFCDNIVKEEDSFRNCFDGDIEWEYFTCKEGEIKNCTFEGISYPLRGSSISDCRFENCKAGVIVFSEKDTSVEDCVFKNCKESIITICPSNITHCQFIACYDRIISAYSAKGGVNIEFCDFYNVKNSMEYDDTNIIFMRDKGSKTKINTVYKCIFNGVQMGNNYLIGACNGKKPNDFVAVVRECDFRNCITEKKDGKIIKEYLYYENVFKKEQIANSISVEECRGLDRINLEGNECQSFEIKTTSSKGNEIGSKIGGTGAVVLLATAIGGPLAKVGVSAGKIVSNQINKHKNKKASQQMSEIEDDNSFETDIIKLTGDIQIMNEGPLKGEKVVIFSKKLYRENDLLDIVKEIWTDEKGKKIEDFKNVEINVIIDGSKGFANYVINGKDKGSFVI